VDRNLANLLRIRVLGDFIRDRQGRAADLEHLPDWLTNQDPAAATATRTGDGVPGGWFESWFAFSVTGDQPGPIDGNPGLIAVAADIMANNRDTATALAVADAVPLSTALAEGDGANGPVRINSAGAPALLRLPGVDASIASAIVNARAAGPIRNESDLLAVPGVTGAALGRIRNLIDFA